ncbi:MAG: globin family protein [Pseudomonadota bacterium]
MTPEQIELVQSSWQKVKPISEQAAELFYSRLFILDPDARSLFTGDMAAQGKKLMTMITTAVNGLRNLEAIVPAVQELGRRHVGYGVTNAHYDTVGEALLWTLEQGLGDAFDEPTKAAWTETYTILATTMKAAAAEAEASAA